MAPSATDIITYIGVPLAVLGVMPVLYTFFKALVTKSYVRRTIKKNNIHHSATTSTSLMSGEVQLQLPRYTISPPLRDSDDYWLREDLPSSLKGGTWTLFRWRKMITGKVKYGLQLHDEVRQPAAEIEFEGLVTFLLDRGAVPDADGVRMLKTMGLMTPKNTPLLVAGGGRSGTSAGERLGTSGGQRIGTGGIGGGNIGAKRSVLVVSSPDDSEGHLVLRLFWSDRLMERDVQDLPPYWTRLASFVSEGAEKAEVTTAGDARDVKDVTVAEDMKIDIEPATAEKAGVKKAKKDENTASEGKEENIEDVQVAQNTPQDTTSGDAKPSKLPSVRMYVGPTGLEDARLEMLSGRVDPSVPPPSLSHLVSPNSIYPASYASYPPPSYNPAPSPAKSYPQSISSWFPTLAITVLGQNSRGLWRYTIPASHTTFASRDSVPHGVLVHLTLLPIEDTPMSQARARARRERELSRQQDEHRESMRAMQAENNLPPHLRDAARQKRNMDTVLKMSQRMQNERLEREQEALDRKADALMSPRVSNVKVADACLRYLQQLQASGDDKVGRNDRKNWKAPHDKHPVLTSRSRQEIAEYALHLMLFDAEFAASVCGILEKWRGWSEDGVINDRQLDEVEEDIVGFCFAGLLVDILRERAGARETWAGQDLADVQNAWRTVWLE